MIKFGDKFNLRDGWIATSVDSIEGYVNTVSRFGWVDYITIEFRDDERCEGLKRQYKELEKKFKWLRGQKMTAWQEIVHAKNWLWDLEQRIKKIEKNLEEKVEKLEKENTDLKLLKQSSEMYVLQVMEAKDVLAKRVEKLKEIASEFECIASEAIGAAGDGQDIGYAAEEFENQLKELRERLEKY